jgi:hypothetical protein
MLRTAATTREGCFEGAELKAGVGLGGATALSGALRDARSAMTPDLDPRQAREGRLVGADDHPSCHLRRSGNQQIVRSARSPMASNVYEELRVCFRNTTIVVKHWYDVEDVVQERLSR